MRSLTLNVPAEYSVKTASIHFFAGPKVLLSRKIYIVIYSYIAGLSSLGVLIIEAGEKSGSLITAKIARQEGKKVYAVPGNVTSTVSAGTNLLIKKGEAIFVTNPEDILGLKLRAGSRKQHLELSLFENKIFKVLKTEPLNVDEIAAQIDESVVAVGTTLSIMGLKGLVIESAGKFYLQK